MVMDRSPNFSDGEGAEEDDDEAGEEGEDEEEEEKEDEEEEEVEEDEEEEDDLLVPRPAAIPRVPLRMKGYRW